MLVVDDDERVRGLIVRMLTKHGYRALVAVDAEEALQLWRWHRARVIALVSDVAMPRMSGADLGARLRSERPDLPVLLVSGTADEGSMRSGLPVLGKPFTEHDLLAALADAGAVA